MKILKIIIFQELPLSNQMKILKIIIFQELPLSNQTREAAKTPGKLAQS